MIQQRRLCGCWLSMIIMALCSTTIHTRGGGVEVELRIIKFLRNGLTNVWYVNRIKFKFIRNSVKFYSQVCPSPLGWCSCVIILLVPARPKNCSFVLFTVELKKFTLLGEIFAWPPQKAWLIANVCLFTKSVKEANVKMDCQR